MHETLLFGQVPNEGRHRLLQQLAGITRMQPRHVVERHLVFKALPPPALVKLQSGGSQGVQSPEVQRTKAMLGGPLFYIQLVGDVTQVSHGLTNGTVPGDAQGSTEESTINGEADSGFKRNEAFSTGTKWSLEFRDIPDAGKDQSVTSRLMFRNPIEGGDIPKFMKELGYEYVSEYALEGEKFYDQDATIFLHRVLKVSHGVDAPKGPHPLVSRLPRETLEPLDGSGSYVIQTSVEVEDGNKPDLTKRAVNQLLRLKDVLNDSVVLNPIDRLDLDTRINTRMTTRVAETVSKTGIAALMSMGK